MTTRIAVLIACFNRREKTVACIGRLLAWQHPGLHIWLCDDGSRDGTSDEAIALGGSAITVLHGDGSLFWNGSMRRAWDAARTTNPDLVWWVNDDVNFSPTALEDLLACHQRHPTAVIVGSTTAPDRTLTTYGGLRRISRLNPLRLSRIDPSAEADLPCDTCNGNAVVVPRSVYESVEQFPGPFRHGMGDFDFGFRVVQHGGELRIARRAIGTCPRNSARGTWQDPALPLRERWQRIRSPKGLPFYEWWTLCWRHAGWLAPVVWIAPYIRAIFPRPIAADATT